MVEIVHVGDDELRDRIARILDKYPFFDGYAIDCHSTCTGRDIGVEHGPDAEKAWGEYETAKYLLGE